jgi:hypothetical protein
MKVNFFDRQKVIALTDEVTRKGLSGSAAYVRRVAINSMRRDRTKAQNPAAPGRPPKFRADDESVSLRNIQFFYEESSKSAVVGPIKLNQHQYGDDGVLQIGTVPAVHEFGGTAGIRERLVPFTFAEAFRRYGAAVGKAFLATGHALPRPAAERVYGKQARYRIDESAGGTWVPVGRSGRRRTVIARTRTARYPARPFMWPALQKAIAKGKIPQAFIGRVGTT